MNRWAMNHPEQMAEIARLPLPSQNAAMRSVLSRPTRAQKQEARLAVEDAKRAAVQPVTERRCETCKITPAEARAQGKPRCKDGGPHRFRWVRSDG